MVLQPNYLPWIGTFDLMAHADVWIWLDTVQYTKNDWRNRNKIAAGSEEPFWLSLPVKTRGRSGQTIAEAELDDRADWGARHLRSLEQTYAKSPHREELLDLLREILQRRQRLLVDLTIPACERIGRALGCSTAFKRATELGVDSYDGSSARVVALCRNAEATHYITGPAARGYLDVDAFRQAGIKVVYAAYDYPPYERGSHTFHQGLSTADILAWQGCEETRSYMRRHSALSFQ